MTINQEQMMATLGFMSVSPAEAKRLTHGVRKLREAVRTGTIGAKFRRSLAFVGRECNFGSNKTREMQALIETTIEAMSTPGFLNDEQYAFAEADVATMRRNLSDWDEHYELQQSLYAISDEISARKKISGGLEKVVVEATSTIEALPNAAAWSRLHWLAAQLAADETLPEKQREQLRAHALHVAERVAWRYGMRIGRSQRSVEKDGSAELRDEALRRIDQALEEANIAGSNAWEDSIGPVISAAEIKMGQKRAQEASEAAKSSEAQGEEGASDPSLGSSRPQAGTHPSRTSTNSNTSSANQMSEVDQLQQRVGDFLRTRRPDIDSNLVAAALASLLSGSLTLLAGAPGGGKTTMLELIGYALGSRTVVVYVDPEWASPNEAIGTGDPLDAARVQLGSIGQVMLNAAREPERLHLMILDEINLAQPEQYASSLIGQIDRGGRARSIRITSESAARRLGEGTAEEVIRDNQGMMPWGKNLLIAATANQDHTTRALSPRLIDRSSVITLTGKYSIGKLMYNQTQVGKPPRLTPVRTNQLPQIDPTNSAHHQTLLEIDNALQLVDLGNHSARSGKNIMAMLSAMPSSMDSYVAVDLSIASHLLPSLIASAQQLGDTMGARKLSEAAKVFASLHMQRSAELSSAEARRMSGLG